MKYPSSSFVKQNNILFIRTFMVLLLSCGISKLNLCFSSVPSLLKVIPLEGHLSFEANEFAARDYGNLHHSLPLAVLYPKSVSDIANTIKYIWQMGPSSKLTVVARGHGHSINGQSQAEQGIVINMKSLHLTVGGTLSNAGISGQAFRHGPQISNVHQMCSPELVSGKGEVLNCSEEQNADLFHSVLGGLGQFGIITHARISLEPAPENHNDHSKTLLNCISVNRVC